MSLLEPSWAALGAVLGALGAVLGPSWAPLGALLGHLGAILRPQEPIGREKARMQKTLKNTLFLKDFGLLGGLLGWLGEHLGPSWGGLEGSWRQVESKIEPSWAILRDLGGHLGLSGALLEPSWAILDAPTTRDHPTSPNRAGEPLQSAQGHGTGMPGL